MSDINVLVVFYSRFGTTERLGLAAGLGAIQAKANIRLRRVVDRADRATIDASAAWKENLERMSRDYVAPRPADPAWADVIVLASPDDAKGEVESYCDTLRSIGPMTGKLGAVLTPERNPSALGALYAAAGCAGLTVVPAPEAGADPAASAREFGRRVTEMARVLKK